MYQTGSEPVPKFLIDLYHMISCALDRNCPKLVYRCISILNDLQTINFIAPIPNWGNVQFGYQWLQLRTCPNSELGQCPTWGTSVSTSDLPQFRIGAMFNLGHRWLQLWTCPNSELGQCSIWGNQCFNFRLAPIPNWGNVQFGAPVFQLWTCPN